ncbi:LOW QUALITY PROTEIN: ATP-dependent DNA helicase [Frankliniella fusca]|uniref:ATP-dependent DNA helicase n=1 Tax=Frankliniella fusca TaxID=407009 RepID=A0AAE1GY47_9NEOP|nr:LOW QUALITY PROTEIN: ATP-dependent DNA helicase [Frankliniella fusca]
MPRNVLTELISMIQKLKEMCDSEKGLYFKFDQQLLEKRRKALQRQQKHRQTLDEISKRKSKEKDRKRMTKVRNNKSKKQKDQERRLNSERRFIASNCHKRSIQSSFTKFKCSKNCSLFTQYNDMDPFVVPEQLQSLTYIEKQLISRIHPVISLYRVKKLQYKYKGQVINFTQDVQKVADSLPYMLEDLTHVVIVTHNDKIMLKDFLKTESFGCSSLAKKNNPHYSDIHIDETSLDHLPVNGNVYSKLKTIQSENESELVNDKTEQCSDDNNTNDDVDDIVYTSVPDNNDISLPKTFSTELVWPSIGTTPINEFSSPGYITMAFLHLFCYGTADYSMPRSQKVPINQYIHHLMLYHDERFAKDERFRYFIMNSEMRWNSLNIEYFKENPWVVNQIMHFGSRLRTTKPYWKSRCAELSDMVDQIGTPTVFFTLSSADYYWPDLFRLMGHDVNSLTIQQRAQLLSQNPFIADTFFNLRSKFFLENSFTKHFEVQDMWYRYEYQHRGSIHVHGLAWLKNAPIIKDDMTENENENVIKYFDGLISCKNPNIHITPMSTHPCQLSLDSVTDTESDLAHLVNQVQRHTKCSRSHCLRSIGKDKTLMCRYKFPKELIAETNLQIENGTIVDINFARNDCFVNKYNAWVLQTWRSNIDFSPIFNKQIVYRYIAKYASKSEIKSISYNEVLTDIVNKTCDDSEPCKKAIRKLLISSCAERDYSAQEVMHFLMGYKFYHSTREFVVVNLKNIDWTSVAYGVSEKIIFECYAKRSILYEKISLFEFAKFLKSTRMKTILRKKPAIVRFFPKPHNGLDSVTLLITLQYKKYICHTDVHVSSDDEDFSEFDDLNKEKYSKDNESFLSEYNPNMKSYFTELKQVNNDNVKWDYLSHKLNRETIHKICEKLQSDFTYKKFEKTDYSSLNNEQLKVFNHIRMLTNDLAKGFETTYKFMIVQGMAGTGKTYLLKCCANYIRSKLGMKAVQVVSYTGVSAKLINVTTLHSFLSLGKFHNNCERLKGTELLNFREKHAGLKFLFVDEYSMVGLRLLACIETRCKDISGMDALFGNLTVVLFGDINQLLPIGDQPLYANVDFISQNNNLLEKGKILMSELTHAYVLNKCHRFANIEYVNFLKKVSSGRCTDHDFELMKTRYINFLPVDERLRFKNSLRICSTNENANEYNLRNLKKLNMPIAVIHAQNNNKTAFSCTDDIADGLTNILSLCIGAKIMLRRNINVTRGFVNGSIGILKHIMCERNCKPPSVPLCVLVQFENVDTDDLNITYIPILPVLSQWYKKGISCTRYQLPISLCWACTIHKSQGLTLGSMALDAGNSEFALGLLYVALSRVADMDSLCLITMFTLDRLNSCTKSSKFKLRTKFLKKADKNVITS